MTMMMNWLITIQQNKISETRHAKILLAALKPYFYLRFVDHLMRLNLLSVTSRERGRD